MIQGNTPLTLLLGKRKLFSVVGLVDVIGDGFNLEPEIAIELADQSISDSGVCKISKVVKQQQQFIATELIAALAIKSTSNKLIDLNQRPV